VDVGQFEQVVVNLAVNARDAMPAGGKLTIELANVELGEATLRAQFDPGPSPHVLLAVSDTGIGMDAATRTHIFEPFFTTKEEGHGTGMGLATVYGIVRQFGGSIDVDSEPGHGTTFRIYLPAVVGVATATVAPAITARPTPAGTETILLVEDQEAVLTFERRVLEHDGYAVLGAVNGAEALSIAASHAGPIALLVTDVVMPGLQGNLLAEQLTADRPGLRVLFVSGFSENAVGYHGVGEGEVAFLGKPFSAGALCTAVRAVLDEPAR
jgi:CheY-like chemotaxis protein